MLISGFMAGWLARIWDVQECPKNAVSVAGARSCVSCTGDTFSNDGLFCKCEKTLASILASGLPALRSQVQRAVRRPQR